MKSAIGEGMTREDHWNVSNQLYAMYAQVSVRSTDQENFVSRPRSGACGVCLFFGASGFSSITRRFSDVHDTAHREAVPTLCFCFLKASKKSVAGT